MLAVAIDAQGPERVRPFVQEAQATYPVLVDQDNTLGTIFGFKAIPNAFVIDEAGVLRYERVGTFTIKKPELREELRLVLTQSFTGMSAEAATGAGADEVARVFAEGVRQYQAGQIPQAIAVWRRAWQLDPENFIVRKQIWAAEHPEKFYPRIDFDWQKERLERGT